MNGKLNPLLFFLVLLLAPSTVVTAQDGSDVAQVVLVLDISWEMRPALFEIQTLARRAVEHLPDEAQISVLTFNDFELVSAFGDGQAALNRISSISLDEVQGGSCLYDAIYETVRLLGQKVGQHERVAIVFSNGLDQRDVDVTCSRHTQQEVLTLARREVAPVKIFTVGVDEVDSTFHDLAMGSGGVQIEAEGVWPEQFVESVSTEPPPTMTPLPTTVATQTAVPTETLAATTLPTLTLTPTTTIAVAPTLTVTDLPPSGAASPQLPANWYFIFPILALCLAGVGGIIWWRGRVVTQLPTSLPTPRPVRHTEIIMSATMTLAEALARNRASAELIIIETQANVIRNRPIPITHFPFTIGRVNCDLSINDARISRRHAQIVHENNEFFVTDLGSRNKTFVDGDPIPTGELILLESDTMIGLGTYTLLRFLRTP